MKFNLNLYLWALFCNFIILNVYAQNSEQHRLSGNWNGFRDSLTKNGISIQPRLTFFQNNFVHGTGTKESNFAGKADLKIYINGSKIGIRQLTLVSQIEQNFGKNLYGNGGVVMPVNTALSFPGINGANAFDITSLYFIYQFGTKNSLLLGKINAVDLASGSLYSGGAGIDTFWNMNFSAPVSGITPAYIIGGVSTIHTKAFKYTFMVYDPASAVNKSGLESPFSTGITISAGIEKSFKIFDMSSSHSIKGTYSTQDGTNLYDLGDLFFPTTETIISDKKYRYYFGYKFTQQLGKIKNTKDGWGLFGQIGISDGNPNPVDFGFLIGIGGNSFFKSRSEDKWGIGIYHYSLSKPIDRLSASKGLILHNETGMEMFYQAWINKWFSIGGNTQIIIPMIKNNKTAIFLGLRSSILF